MAFDSSYSLGNEAEQGKDWPEITLCNSWHKQNVNCALPSPFHQLTPQGATQGDGQGGDAGQASHEPQVHANLTPPSEGGFYVLVFPNVQPLHSDV